MPRALAVGVLVALGAALALPGVPAGDPVVLAHADADPECTDWTMGAPHLENCVRDRRLAFTGGGWFVRVCAEEAPGVVEWTGLIGPRVDTGRHTLAAGECLVEGDGARTPGASCALARVTFTPLEGSRTLQDFDFECATLLA